MRVGRNRKKKFFFENQLSAHLIDYLAFHIFKFDVFNNELTHTILARALNAKRGQDPK